MYIRKILSIVNLCLLLWGLTLIAAAQENKPGLPQETRELIASDEEIDNLDSESKPSTTAQEKSACTLCRWIDLQTATFATRYRWVRSNQPVTAAMLKTQPFLTKGKYIIVNQHQQQQIYELNFKFDRAARYKIHTRLSSGAWFTRSFAETGWGSIFNGEKTWAVLPRQFYLSAEPVKGIELQYGGLAINRGENTENTTYDNDGFITGERLSIRRPDKLWFDEISVTYAYIGDFYKPNFFERAHRLNESNYHQYLVGKKFGDRVGISMDYSSHATIGNFRGGMIIKLPEVKIFDSLRAEFYTRLEDYRGVKKASGYNFQIEKNIKKKLFLIAGLTDTDYRYNVLTTEKYPARQAKFAQPAGSLTADRMIRGLSPFLNWRYQIHPYYSIFGFLTGDIAKPQPVSTRPFVFNADHFSIGFQFDLKKMLEGTPLF